VKMQQDSIRQRGNYLWVIIGYQDDSPKHQRQSRCSSRAPDAVKTHGTKGSVSGCRQDSEHGQRQIRTQREIDVVSGFAIDILWDRWVRPTGCIGHMLFLLLMPTLLQVPQLLSPTLGSE